LDICGPHQELEFIQMQERRQQDLGVEAGADIIILVVLVVHRAEQVEMACGAVEAVAVDELS
jgi:hypothetical protein